MTNETLPAYFGLVGRPNAIGSYASLPLCAWQGELYLYFTHKSTGDAPPHPVCGGPTCGAQEKKYVRGAAGSNIILSRR